MAAKQDGLHIPADQLPAPGTEAEIELDGFTVMLWNHNPATPTEPQQGDVVAYKVALTMRNGNNTRYVHAVAMLKTKSRSRNAGIPLCSPKGETQTKVTMALHNRPLDSVTCATCRKRLVEAGALPVDSAAETTEREDNGHDH